MSHDPKPAASPATLDAIRHLARLGVRGWVFVALLLGAIYVADQYLLDDGVPPGPAPAVTDRGDESRSDAPVRPAPTPPDHDFGPEPRSPARPGAPPSEPRSEAPRRTYPVVAVAFRTRAGAATIDLEPGAVLARADGKGLVLAERLKGGEKLKTNCADPATVTSAKSVKKAEIARPPRCAPVVIEPYVERVTVENFGRPVPAAAPGGEVDLSGTLERIALGKKFPHRNDGTTFGNRERRLPRQRGGYYKEYVHPTPGVNGPGPQRLVIGAGGDVWYTPDHYDSFRAVVKP